ncbi:hypothetical protein [Streptomyces spectabilis]|nr:hypothetical protein [Streptomyces spectabilis]
MNETLTTVERKTGERLPENQRDALINDLTERFKNVILDIKEESLPEHQR